MSDRLRLLKACEGKTESQGGMNIPELFRIAASKGYKNNKKRADILAFLCTTKKSPAKSAVSPPKKTPPKHKATSSPPKKTSPKHKVPSSQPPQTFSLTKKIGTFIEPLMHMHTDQDLDGIFKHLTKDRAKLDSFFDKIPLTTAIKDVAKYSMEHDGHLKPSSLVNSVGGSSSYSLFTIMGLPSTEGLYPLNHDLISVAALSDECEFGGTIEFKTSGSRLLLPDDSKQMTLGQLYKGRIANIVKKRITEVRALAGCSVVMFGFGVPGHALIMSIQGENLYIFDTNSAQRALTFREYWSYTEKYGRVDKLIVSFLQDLLSNGSAKKLFINNWNPITELEPGTSLPFVINNIPFDEICPNFQGRSSHLRSQWNTINSYGVNMFPGGFCLPWSFITIATYMTHGEMAPFILQDFLGNPDYYTGYHPDDIPGLQVLFIHLISVYLTELVSLI